MKCARLHRKQIGTLLMVGVLMILLALPVWAGGTLEGTNQTNIEVKAYYEIPTYSVELSWGSMEFKYLYGVGWDYGQKL